MIRILVLGDIVGRPGRNYLLEKLPEIREAEAIDLVIANGENAAAGAGITGKIVRQLVEGGVDGFTLGDHAWDQKLFVEEIEALENICRPANFLPGVPGKDRLFLNASGKRIGLFTVLGQNYMGPKVDCPFRTADRIILEMQDTTDLIIAEVHAEATSEKIALGWYLDGRVSLLFGTHTHVPTADAEILPGGMAYITDLGMCGPYRGVIGRDREAVVGRFLNGMPTRFPVAEEDVRLSGIIFEWDETVGKSISIKHRFWHQNSG